MLRDIDSYTYLLIKIAMVWKPHILATIEESE